MEALRLLGVHTAEQCACHFLRDGSEPDGCFASVDPPPAVRPFDGEGALQWSLWTDGGDIHSHLPKKRRNVLAHMERALIEMGGSGPARVLERLAAYHLFDARGTLPRLARVSTHTRVPA